MAKSEFEILAQMMDRFAVASTADQKWAVARSIAAEAGLNAHNAGAARLDTGALTYMRSDMSEEWLAEYAEEAYFTADRFVDMIWHAAQHQFVIWRNAEARNRKERNLWGRIIDEGYKTGFAHSFDSDRPGERRVISLFSEDDRMRDWRPDRKAQLRAIALVFNAHLFADDHRRGRTLPGRDVLSGREQDVLLLLASGLQNKQIAERLGLAEVTVRMHFSSARQKLSAWTREHALAIALRNNLIG